MIRAILLAAGQSKRMGTQKLVLPFAGRTVVGHIVHQLSMSRVDHVQVVTGCNQREIRQALAHHKVSYTHNPYYAHEMLSSIRCGLQALPPSCDACMVVLGDQPSVTSTLLDELIQAFQGASQGLLVPCYEGKRGHPLLISSAYFKEILTQFDEIGLRGLLHAHPDQVIEHPVSSDWVLSDMDYPSDYRREIRRRVVEGARDTASA